VNGMQSTATKITIGANQDLKKALTAEDFDDLMAWFFDSYIDPADVMSSEPVVIDTSPQVATIDYWMFGTHRPQAAKMIEVRPVSEDKSVAHVIAPMHRPLPPHLVDALSGVRRSQIAEQARIAGQVAKAEAEARVWSEAGY
jgi:hypothetical protein